MERDLDGNIVREWVTTVPDEVLAREEAERRLAALVAKAERIMGGAVETWGIEEVRLGLAALFLRVGR